jgi:protease I
MDREARETIEEAQLMASLSGIRVAVIASDGFEEAELTEPVKALKGAGAAVTIVAPKAGEIQAFRHDTKTIKVPVDRTLDEVSADEFDAVQLPGGALNADFLRVVPALQAFLRAMQDAGKPFAVICHAPWELISSRLVRGRTLTSYHTIRDDVENAGGNWVDREVVEDGNWVTSRKPADIPAFNEAMLRLFAGRLAGAGR